MVWDLNKIKHETELIELTDKSMNTVVEMSSVPANRVLDSGKSNRIQKKSEFFIRGFALFLYLNLNFLPPSG